jgi:hypothetical protein
MNKLTLIGLVFISLTAVFIIAFLVIPKELLLQTNLSNQQLNSQVSPAPEFEVLDQPVTVSDEQAEIQDDNTSSSQVSLIAVGDIMLARSVNTSMIRREDWKLTCSPNNAQ